jgi:hypothetical protein
MKGDPEIQNVSAEPIPTENLFQKFENYMANPLIKWLAIIATGTGGAVAIITNINTVCLSCGVGVIGAGGFFMIIKSIQNESRKTKI